MGVFKPKIGFYKYVSEACRSVRELYTAGLVFYGQ